MQLVEQPEDSVQLVEQPEDAVQLVEEQEEQAVEVEEEEEREQAKVDNNVRLKDSSRGSIRLPCVTIIREQYKSFVHT